MMKCLRSVLFICALLLVSAKAIACDLGLSATSPEPVDIASAKARLTERLFSTAPEPSSLNKTGIGLVQQIDCYLETQSSHLTKLKNIRPSLLRSGNALHQASNTVETSMALEGINASVNRDAGTGFVVFPNTSAGRTEISLYDEVISPNCDSSPSVTCAENLNLAISLWWIAGQYRSFANNFNQAAKTQSLAYNQRLDAQWRSYKNDTIKLWPQEVLLNSLVYRPAQRGLSAPPRYKLLALRPSLGLSYLSDQSHRIQPTLNIDLLGVYWWQYQDQLAGPGRGIAASLIWDGDDTAYGLSYHHNPKWSLSLAQGDDNDLVVSVSFQIAYWLLKR